jgi:hypothetical protein
MTDDEKKIAEDLVNRIKTAVGPDERMTYIHGYNIFLEAIQGRLQIARGDKLICKKQNR